MPGWVSGVVKVPSDALLLPAPCTGLTACWAQDGSLAPGVWMQEAEGWPRPWEARDKDLSQKRPALIADHGSLSEIEDLPPGTHEKEGRPWASCPRPHMHVRWQKPRRAEIGHGGTETPTMPCQGPSLGRSDGQHMAQLKTAPRPQGITRGSPPGSNDITLLLSVVTTRLGPRASPLPALAAGSVLGSFPWRSGQTAEVPIQALSSLERAISVATVQCCEERTYLCAAPLMPGPAAFLSGPPCPQALPGWLF